MLETNATLVTAYMVFFIAEHHSVHVSGMISIVVLGLYMSHNGRTRISTESEEAIHSVWSYVGFCAETAIFILAGLWLANAVSYDHITAVDFGKIFLLYILLFLIRLIAIMIFYPLLRLLGYGLDLKTVVLMAYSGLRGAVSLCLALLVQRAAVDEHVSGLILFHTAGVVILTLLINGTTTGWLIKLLNLQ